MAKNAKGKKAAADSKANGDGASDAAKKDNEEKKAEDQNEDGNEWIKKGWKRNYNELTA